MSSHRRVSAIRPGPRRVPSGPRAFRGRAPRRAPVPLTGPTRLPEGNGLDPLAIGIVLRVILVVAAAVRIVAAIRLSSHIDEPASVLAIRMVAERGVPVFPSGVLYLQGATLSYLLAPLVWLGQGDLDHLTVLRLGSVLAGTLAVLLTYRLGRSVSGRPWLALLAATLVTLDPISVQWSAHVRMYAPLQALTLAVVWLFVEEISAPPGRPRARGQRRLLWMVLAFWAAIFTQIGAALIWPPMVLVAMLARDRPRERTTDRWPWRLLPRRDLTLALACCLLAPITLTAINGIWSGGEATAVEQGVHRPSFVGDYLLSGRRIVDPELTAWTALFARGAFAGLIPMVIAVLSGLLVGRYLLVTTSRPVMSRQARAVGALLAFYWGAIVVVAALTFEPQSRYLVHIQPLGFVLATTAVGLLPWVPSPRRFPVHWQHRLPGLAGIVIALLLLVQVSTGTASRLRQPVVDADYIAALRYVAARRAPDEQVATALPPAATLLLGGRAGLHFLAGPTDSPRVARYTRTTSEGRRIDFWAGAGAIVSTDQLCEFLIGTPTAWIVVDTPRLRATWAYAGPFADVITGSTVEVAHLRGQVLVLRPRPPSSWSHDAASACSGGAGGEPGQRVRSMSSG